MHLKVHKTEIMIGKIGTTWISGCSFWFRLHLQNNNFSPQFSTNQNQEWNQSEAGKLTGRATRDQCPEDTVQAHGHEGACELLQICPWRALIADGDDFVDHGEYVLTVRGICWGFCGQLCKIKKRHLTTSKGKGMDCYLSYLFK